WFFPWSIFISYVFREFPRPRTWGEAMQPAQQARLLLFIWAGLILFFFSLTSGSRMEYYSFGGWPAIAILLGLGIANAEELQRGWMSRLQAMLAIVGVAASVVLGYFVWKSWGISATEDISELLNRYSIESYHLSMSHIFDLTAQTFAALRGPAM